MSVIDSLIFDRTQSDISNDTNKSYISYEDLNRIEEAVEYISNLLKEYSYDNEVDVKKNWNMSDFRKQEECDRIRENYEILRKSFAYDFEVPEFRWKDIKEANEIEKILYDLSNMVDYISTYFIHTGVANSGQDRLWQQRFRRTRNWANQNYKFSQYLEEDTILDISSMEKGVVEEGNKIYKHQKIVNSIATINDSMNKIDKLVGYPEEFYLIKNLIPDNSFENNKWNDTNNNSTYSTEEKAFGNRSLHFAVGTTIVANIEIERPIIGHKYYGRRYIKTNGDNQPADCRFEVFGGDGANKNWVYAWNNGNHPDWEFNSAIYKIEGVDYPETDRTIIRCFNVNTTADTWVDGLMLVDLTDCFGEGNEPNLEWCDENIPYIEERKMISVKK